MVRRIDDPRSRVIAEVEANKAQHDADAIRDWNRMATSPEAQRVRSLLETLEDLSRETRNGMETMSEIGLDNNE